jgi:hypothetical protein
LNALKLFKIEALGQLHLKLEKYSIALAADQENRFKDG